MKIIWTEIKKFTAVDWIGVALMLGAAWLCIRIIRDHLL